jgi:hypothetical protein
MFGFSVDLALGMGAFKDISMLMLSLLFIPFGGMIFMAQYTLIFWHFGLLGYVYSLWHVISFTIMAFYVDYRRSKNFENWRYESRPITTKQIDDYVSFVKENKKEKHAN